MLWKKPGGTQTSWQRDSAVGGRWVLQVRPILGPDLGDLDSTTVAATILCHQGQWTCPQVAGDTPRPHGPLLPGGAAGHPWDSRRAHPVFLVMETVGSTPVSPFLDFVYSCVRPTSRSLPESDFLKRIALICLPCAFRVLGWGRGGSKDNGQGEEAGGVLGCPGCLCGVLWKYPIAQK